MTLYCFYINIRFAPIEIMLGRHTPCADCAYSQRRTGGHGRKGRQHFEPDGLRCHLLFYNKAMSLVGFKAGMVPFQLALNGNSPREGGRDVCVYHMVAYFGLKPMVGLGSFQLGISGTGWKVLR